MSNSTAKVQADNILSPYVCYGNGNYSLNFLFYVFLIGDNSNMMTVVSRRVLVTFSL